VASETETATRLGSRRLFKCLLGVGDRLNTENLDLRRQDETRSKRTPRNREVINDKVAHLLRKTEMTQENVSLNIKPADG